MNKPENYNSTEMHELADFAWDRSRRNADAERVKAIASFFVWFSRRERRAKPAPEAISALRDRAVAPVALGISS